jgi:hypothetical protein
MRTSNILAFALLIATPALRAGEPIVLRAEPAPAWNERFAGKKGWIGGDGVCSIALESGRIVWLFDDTLIGQVKDNARKGAVFVNNTVGVQDKPSAEIRFVTGKSADDKPAAILIPADGKGWLWPQSGVQVGKQLVLFLAQIDKSGDPGVFGFKPIAQWLAFIENPEAEPTAWKVRQVKVSHVHFGPEKKCSWGSALCLERDELFIYGYEEQGKGLDRRRLLVAKAPASSPDDFKSWRFRTKDGWSAEVKEAAPLGGGLATEFSVVRLANSSDYLLVYTEYGLSDRIVARQASSPVGPWSAPTLLYRCPEMAKDKGVFSYAGRAHAFATTERRLLLSYCVNAWDVGRLVRDESVYRPKFVQVDLK